MVLAEPELDLIKEDEQVSKFELYIKSMTEESLEQIKKQIDNPEVLDQILTEMNNSYVELKNGDVRIE